MKSKEKDDLSTLRRSSRIAKAKNTSTKKSSRLTKASRNLGTGHHFTKREKTLIKNLNQWIRKGIERERKGESVFPTCKNQRSCSAVTAKICEISRFSVDKLLSKASTETEDKQEPKTRSGRKPIILDSFNQSLLRRIVLNFYCRGEIPNLEKIHRQTQDADGFPKLGVETLTLPVRRYLVPTPSTKGALSQPSPYDLENGRLYKLLLWQTIRTIYER